MSDRNWDLYSHNREAWEAMLADCARAEKRIVLEQFIFFPDEFGNRLIDMCAERAENGVDVKFLWDAAGSFRLWHSDATKDLLVKKIRLIFWRTLIPHYQNLPKFRSWFLRNHRRTLVIDGKVAYTGSICVADHMKSWRDTNVRIIGIPAKQMENAFDRMWDRATHSRPLTKKLHYADNAFRYVTNFPAPGRRNIYTEFIQAIRDAKQHIYITTPYFVPTHKIVRLLRNAAHRGVRVEIILPERSDHRLVDLGARSYFANLLASGIKIHLYRGNMIHSKTMTIDDQWASIGSMNMDRISLLYNFEANIVANNREFASKIREHFMTDIESTIELTAELWNKRSLVERIPIWFASLFRKFL